MKFKCFFLVSLLASGLTGGANGYAQVQYSAGCDYINSSTWPITANWIQIFLEFSANEVIVASTTSDLASGSPIPTRTRLYVDESEVDEDGFPGVVSYRFPSDGVANVRWEVDNGNAIWVIGCSVSQPSAPVPAFGWPGAVLLAILLGCFAIFRLAISRQSGTLASRS